MKKLLKISAVIMILLMIAGACEAVVRNGSIDGRRGLYYSEISYGFKNLSIRIRNHNKYNVNFGGSMLFLDKNYKVIARAELLNAKIKRHSSRKFKAFFSKGSGNEAKNARYIEWEF